MPEPGRAPSLRLTIHQLPRGFGTTADVEAATGRKKRSITNDCLEAGIAIKVTRPAVGGQEWGVHKAGAAALPVALSRGDAPRDTGAVCDAVRVLADARRVVATFVEALPEDCMPGDTGPICDARRVVEWRDTGAHWAPAAPP